MARRPALSEMTMDEAMKYITGPARGKAIITLSVGQWDYLLDACYKSGWILLEVDDNERPVRAYCKNPKEGIEG